METSNHFVSMFFVLRLGFFCVLGMGFRGWGSAFVGLGSEFKVSLHGEETSLRDETNHILIFISTLCHRVLKKSDDYSQNFQI